jgi:FlaA1/EpsC-like NDP-sugar epimerase
MQQIFRRFSPSRFSFQHIGLDVILMLASLYASLWLRLGEGQWDQHAPALHHLAAAFVLIRILTFIGFGVYQSLWRYISTHDATRLATAVASSMPLFISVTYFFPNAGPLPRSFFIIDAFVCATFLMGVRLLRRRVFEWRMSHHKKGEAILGKLIIYGAGNNGRLLAQRLLSDPARDRELLGFLDDNPAMRDRFIQTLPVLGHRAEMEDILSQSGCTDLIVAITHPPPELMRELLILGRRLGIRVQKIAHIENGRQEALYRQVELKDLLNRPSLEIDLPSIKRHLQGKVVLVTGAGGSIGSELSRQIARFSPGKLLLLDHSEFNLYEIDQELRPATQNFDRVIPLLVDLKDRKILDQVFSRHRPEVVFHAAAYKHVHLVEANIAASVLNNVLGTLNLLDLCEQSGVERFVMISTDKAVNPVGAMGATKRVCELMTSQAGLRTGKAYSSVRFGNVLGSSGSLIPLLQKQIESGGPVTVTHPEMTRYFMLIPEAVSLVLMSATLSLPGDINVLKMGAPIRILDLARSLLALMAKSEDEIGIAFTGVRPGEKMFEELYLTGAELTTRHPDILTVPRGDLHAESACFMQLRTRIESLIAAAERGDPTLAAKLHDLAGLPRLDISAVPTADLVES